VGLTKRLKGTRRKWCGDGHRGHRIRTLALGGSLFGVQEHRETSPAAVTFSFPSSPTVASQSCVNSSEYGTSVRAVRCAHLWCAAAACRMQCRARATHSHTRRSASDSRG
jgi:hypothetical protein